jgi:outer membrane murein-binding lipoprotein Lpp
VSVTLMLRFIAVFVGIACLAGCAAAPVQEMSDARQAIGAARAAGATEANSPEMFAAAEAITRAERHLQAQEYARARLEAMLAKRHAGAALDGVQGAGPVTPGTATTGAKPPSATQP